MQDFIFKNNTELVFGREYANDIGAKLKAFNPQKVFVVYGQQSVIKSGLLKRVTDSLASEGIKFVEYGGVKANPLKSHAEAGVNLAKKEQADFVLAVGGGSVIDAAKAIATGAVNDDMWKFYTQDVVVTKALPVAAVLTLPAAGSEGSTATVLVEDGTNLKFSFGSEAVRPVVAFVNPENCMTLPKEQIANGASDIFAHLMERFFSPLNNVVLTDNLLIGAMRAMVDIAPRIYKDNGNYDLWTEFCLLGTLAHNDMLNMGRYSQDWGTHRIENKLLSGPFDIAHGQGLAIVFLAWLKHVAVKKPQKIVQYFTAVFGVDAKGKDSDIVAKGLKTLEAWYKSIGLPTTLADVKIKVADVKALISKAFDKSDVLGDYGQVTVDEIGKILDLAQ